jgi:ornithine--oxo-acid transaminase
MEGKKYLDFLAAYSAVNQGHCHPRLVEALTSQASKLDLSSRAFYSEKFGEFAEFATQYFGYDRILPMNTGAEAVETAVKMARRWGYQVKGIPENEAIIIVAQDNFHGRTISVVSFSTDPSSREGFGPFTPGFKSVEYGNLEEFEALFSNQEFDSSRIAAFLVEPIQGEAGVVIPPAGYLSKVRELCKKNNVLFMADEIQSGLGRSGQLLAYCWDCAGCGPKTDANVENQMCGCGKDLKPDVVILGKALSGGIYPVSAVLSSHEVMDVFTSGSHGSTYGGNAIASAVAIEALKVLQEEKLVQNSAAQGVRFRKNLKHLMELDYVADVRGRGLFNAIEIVPNTTRSAWEICLALAKRGILCKPTHDHIIRLTPPLSISSMQMELATQVISSVITNVHELKDEDLLEDK